MRWALFAPLSLKKNWLRVQIELNNQQKSVRGGGKLSPYPLRSPGSDGPVPNLRRGHFTEIKNTKDMTTHMICRAHRYVGQF